MTELEVTSQIIQALATYLKRDPSTITESHHLRDDLGLDSVAIIELLFEIEDRFKIQIPDQDLPGLSTVGSVATYVHQRLTTGQTSPSAEIKPAPASKKPTGAGGKRSVITSKKPAAAGRKPATALKKRAAAPKKVTAAKDKKR
ncbi:MAG: acyl carrier protein [Nitrospira sp.]|nr:acyl carrier protein [Nitrospira sp.]MCP9442599.1 acyl carrier protein [Nitrospira sp.]